jgi:hypothetical protein
MRISETRTLGFDSCDSASTILAFGEIPVFESFEYKGSAKLETRQALVEFRSQRRSDSQ